MAKKRSKKRIKKTGEELEAEIFNKEIQSGKAPSLDTVKRWTCKELGTTFAEVLIGGTRSVRSKKTRKMIFERILWAAFDTAVFEIRRDIDDIVCDCAKAGCPHDEMKQNIKRAILKRMSNYQGPVHADHHSVRG